MSNDTSDSERSNTFWPFAVAIAALPLLYILLLGPAVRWYDQLPGPVQKALEVIYTPLQKLSEVPGIGDVLTDYVELWER